MPADDRAVRFYREALAILRDAAIPHLVGGAYAFARYTGIERDTKDFDVFIRKDDCGRATWAFRQAGYRTELAHAHWLAKVHHGDHFVDLIFSAGNGVAMVDDRWFEFAVPGRVFGDEVSLIPPEEMIWSKAQVMERERFDGADVAHVIRATGDRLDWQRLLERFGPLWHPLLAHLVLFNFIYPSERSKVPPWVIAELAERMTNETAAGDAAEKICYGTILSRQQYLHDLEKAGYRDARLVLGTMTEGEIADWTDGIDIDGK